MFHYRGILNHNNRQEKAFVYRHFDFGNGRYILGMKIVLSLNNCLSFKDGIKNYAVPYFFRGVTKTFPILYSQSPLLGKALIVCFSYYFQTTQR